MPIITFASPKGGVGRTTSAIVLATVFSRTYWVTMIDADPSQRLMSWAKKGKLPNRLNVMVSKGERHLHNEIEDAHKVSEFVIIDLEGFASRLNAFAMGESDLVIIPMGDEQQDAEGAIETLAQVTLETRRMCRDIPARILFCRTEDSKAKSDFAKSINEQFRARCSCFETELRRLSAFSWIHNLGGSLLELDPEEVDHLSKSIALAELFADEVSDIFYRSEGAAKVSGQPAIRPSRDVYDRFQKLRSQSGRTNTEMLNLLLTTYLSEDGK
jgi:chromosome partitioning protein